MDEVGLPKSTLQKTIKELLPKDMRIAGDATDLLVTACNQFVHLLSTQANDISEREKRSTISPEHVIKALEELEFGEEYLEAVKAAYEEWKLDEKEHKELRAGHRKDSSGLTQQQLIELQQRLFQEARAATLSGPLPSMSLDQAVAAGAAPAAQQEQQPVQQQRDVAPHPEQQQQQQQQGEPDGSSALELQQQGVAATAAAAEDDNEELADVDVDSELEG